MEEGREGRMGEQRLATRSFFSYDLRKKKMISESGRTAEGAEGEAFRTFGGLRGSGGNHSPRAGVQGAAAP